MLPIMFLRAFRELGVPYEVAEEALLRDPEAWLPAVADAAAADRDALLAEVGFGTEGRRVERRVRIDLGSPARTASSTIFPLRWEPVDARAALPALDGDLELARLGPQRCQLALNGRYTPPLGRIGALLDRTLMHRVAEATAWDLVDRIGDRVAGPTRDPAPPTRARPTIGRPVG
jgi:hypothetical protein